MTDRAHYFLTIAVATWSGFFVMAVELLGARIIAPHFGSSIYVWGALITVFMLSLSLGYLLGGRLSLHNPSLRRLALILAAAAITLVPVLLFHEPVLEWLFDRIEDPRFGSLVAATVLFIVPTVVSGMVSPYGVRLLVTEYHLSGRSTGILLFFSTFGSALGTLVTSFWLVLLLEINQIMIGLVGISVSVAAVAWALGARSAARA